MHPSDHISAALLTLFLLWTHSGAMYWGVPTKLTWDTRRGSAVASTFFLIYLSLKSSDEPKSIRRTLYKSSLKNIFSGFKSRWTISNLCSFSTLLQIPLNVNYESWGSIIPNDLQCSQTSHFWTKISVRKYKLNSSLKVPINLTHGMSWAYASLILLRECFSNMISAYRPILVTF
jgi:hypothetical protein